MPSPLDMPNFSEGQELSSAALRKLARAAGRQSLQPGQFQTGAINVQRRTVGGGSGSGDGTATGIGILIDDVPACSVSYSATDPFSSITPGVSSGTAVIPIIRDGTSFTARLNDAEDEQVVLKALNPVWPTQIKAGTTTNADKPVIVEGYEITVEGESEEDEDVDYWVITNVIYPVTIMKGLCQGAVAGGSFTADNLTLWWGRAPGVSSIASIANPAGLEGDDNAVCVIMQIPDGSWVCLGIECPA